MLVRQNILRCPPRVIRLRPGCRRKYSLVSVHWSFPATMYRFQLQRKSTLFDYKIEHGRYCQDSLSVSKKGLVYPMVSKSFPYSNGPVFRPNTMLLQEILRNHWDYYVEELEACPPEDPHVVCVRKGTSIPDGLVLFRQEPFQFSLQPSYPLRVNEFNNVLDEFYSKAAVITDAVEWMEKHEYRDAFWDSSEEWLNH